MPVTSGAVFEVAPLPRSLVLAARLSGGEVTFYYLDLNGGAPQTLATITAPAGLGTSDLQNSSIIAAEGLGPLVAVRDSSAVHIMTTAGSVSVSDFTSTMDDYSTNQAWGIFRDGGRIYQWMYGEDGEATPRTEIWGLTSAGRDSTQTAEGALGRSVPTAYYEGSYTVEGVSPSVVLDVREADAFRYNGVEYAADQYGTQGGVSVDIEDTAFCCWNDLNDFAYIFLFQDGEHDMSSGAAILASLTPLTTPDGTPTMVWGWALDTLDSYAVADAYTPAPHSYVDPTA